MCRGEELINTRRVTKIVERKLGRIAARGRYHVAPRMIHNDYVVTGKALGKGCTGTIYLATSISDSTRKFAVKSFMLNAMNEGLRAHLQDELETFLSLDHPHIVRLADVYEEIDKISIVMECLEGGELLQSLKAKKQFEEALTADTMRQVLLALNYLHSHNVAHRDLKLENLIYDTKDGGHLKLIDFGFSKYCKKEGDLTATCGTMSYVAPEVLKKSYGSQCDMWSLGVIAFALMSGEMPFYGTKEQKISKISTGEYVMRPDAWRNCSEVAKDFTRSLLVQDPEQRLTAKGGLKHPFIVNNTSPVVSPSVASDMYLALSCWKSAPKLQRACMKLMAWNLCNVEEVAFRDCFLALDSNHDGVISLRELKKFVVEKGIDESAQETFWSLAEHGGDDEIHYSDFIAALMSRRLSEVEDEVLRTTFRKFDKSCAGVITVEDFSEIVGKEFYGASSASILYEANTINADDNVDYAKFEQYLRSLPTEGKKKSPVVTSKSHVAPASSAVRNFAEQHMPQQGCCVVM